MGCGAKKILRPQSLADPELGGTPRATPHPKINSRNNRAAIGVKAA